MYLGFAKALREIATSVDSGNGAITNDGTTIADVLLDMRFALSVLDSDGEQKEIK